MTPKLTETDWRRALKKWRNHSQGISDYTKCVFCEKFLYPTNRKSDNCKGCPLNMGDWSGRGSGTGLCHKSYHPWHLYGETHSLKGAKAVYDFIADKHKAWKAKKRSPSSHI
jgi:hypothetical protein